MVMVTIKFKCGKIIGKGLPNQAKHVPIYELQMNTKQYANGIHYLLNDAMLELKNHQLGALKIKPTDNFLDILQSEIEYNTSVKEMIDNIDEAISKSSSIGDVRMVENVSDEGIFCASTVDETSQAVIDANLALQDMSADEIKKVRYMKAVQLNNCITGELATSDTFSLSPFDFNKKSDRLLHQHAHAIMEQEGYIKCLGPEPGDLPSAYINLSKGKKKWYAIKQSDHFIIAEKLKGLALANCDTPLEHLNWIFSSECLLDHGVDIFTTEQEFGEIVIISPGTFFQTIAIDSVVSDKMTFYGPGFLEAVVRHKICTCPDRPLPTDPVSYADQSLFAAGTLYAVQRAVCGIPGETYQVLEVPLSRTSTQESTPEPTPQKSATGIHDNDDDDDEEEQEDDSVAPKATPRKRKSDCTGGGGARAKKKRKTIVDTRAAALFKMGRGLDKGQHPNGCRCMNCILKQQQQHNLPLDDDIEEDGGGMGNGGDHDNNDGDIPDDADNRQSGSDNEEGDDQNDDSNVAHCVNSTNGGLRENRDGENSGGEIAEISVQAAVAVPLHMECPQMLLETLTRRSNYHVNYFAKRPPELKAHYERTRTTTKKHSKGLTRWFTDEISKDGKKYDEIAKKIQEKYGEAFNNDLIEKRNQLGERRGYLMEMRNAFRILKKIFCLDRDTLDRLIASGYSVMGIFRDYINGTSTGIQGQIYVKAVEVALKTYGTESIPEWLDLGKCKKRWWRKFQLDSRYDIPWQKWESEMKESKASRSSVDNEVGEIEPIKIPESFSFVSQQELEEKCQCHACATRVDCDCEECLERTLSGSVDIYDAQQTQRTSLPTNSPEGSIKRSQTSGSSFDAVQPSSSSPKLSPLIKTQQSSVKESTGVKRKRIKSESHSSKQSTTQSSSNHDSRDDNSKLPPLHPPPVCQNFVYEQSSLPRCFVEKLDEIRRIQTDAGFTFTKNSEEAIPRKYGDIPQYNLDQLKDGCYVGEILVSHYLTLLNNGIKKSKAIIFNPSFTSRPNVSEKEEEKIRSLSTEAKWALMPMIDDKHWRLFVYNIQSRNYFIYDPSYEKYREPDSVEKKATDMLSFLKKCFHDNKVLTQVHSQREKQPEGMPKQPNEYDCAIFVLQVIRLYCRGVEKKKVFVPFARELMLAELLQNSLIGFNSKKNRGD